MGADQNDEMKVMNMRCENLDAIVQISEDFSSSVNRYVIEECVENIGCCKVGKTLCEGGVDVVDIGGVNCFGEDGEELGG